MASLSTASIFRWYRFSPDASLNRTTTYTYDDLDRLRTVTAVQSGGTPLYHLKSSHILSDVQENWQDTLDYFFFKKPPENQGLFNLV